MEASLRVMVPRELEELARVSVPVRPFRLVVTLLVVVVVCGEVAVVDDALLADMLVVAG